MATILQPFGKDASVYLANNDYCIQDFKYMYGDWAEDSLRQVRTTGGEVTSLGQ